MTSLHLHLRSDSTVAIFSSLNSHCRRPQGLLMCICSALRQASTEVVRLQALSQGISQTRKFIYHLLYDTDGGT